MESPSIWRLRGACFGQFVAIGILATFEGVYMKEQGLGETVIGLVIGLGTALTMVSGLLWARLADRGIAEERLIATGFIFGAIGLALLPFCQTAFGFSLNAAFRGLTIPMAFTLMPALVVARLGPTNPGRRYARYRQFGSAGFVLGTLGLPLLVDATRSIFWVASVFLLVAGLLIARDRPAPAVGKTRPPKVAIKWSRPLVTFLLVNFFVGLAMPAMFGFLAVYARTLGADKVVIGFLAGSNGIVAFLSLPLMGWIVDRFGVRRVLWLAFAAHPVRLVAISFAPDYWWLFLAQPLHLFTFAGYDVASILYVGRNVSIENRAMAQALLSTTRMAGVFFGAILSGTLAEHVGYPFMYQFVAALSALSIIVYMVGLRGQAPLKPIYGQTIRR